MCCHSLAVLWGSCRRCELVDRGPYARDFPTGGAEMGAAWALLFLPMVLGLPIACVGLILRLCEWSWRKPSGSMGSTSILAGYGFVCAANLLLVILAGLASVCFGS